MEIVIIGTGNTASVLGRKFKEAGHRIVQVFGRNKTAASELANVLAAEHTDRWNKIKEADLYLLAVSDTAIEEVMSKLNLNEKTIVHTAASVSKDVLKNARHYGVFYPLQSLRKEATGLPEIPLLIDASDEKTLHLLKELANSISEKVKVVDDEERVKLHLAAVFSNNFVNHLYVMTEKYCVQEGVDFRLLLPLIKETANRLDVFSPSQAQTGPAIRCDTETIHKHLAALKAYPQWKALYTLFTESIQKER